jgi:cellulose synthase/poly-beta-1,6-N-acetylglucosamine synthase-like glycosyltransferase
MTISATAQIVFWSAVAALVYTYVGYPLLLLLIGRFRSLPVRRAEWKPTVSVIITAYNEELDLSAKLENTLSLDYPRDLLDVLVVSDSSTDRTDEIARSFSQRGVRLHRQAERFGKTAGQNSGVEQCRGEILLFSDATTHYQPDVLRVMVPNFADPTVGCVSGRLIYVDPADSSVGRGARSYWGYETFLKRHESKICSLIGASGCLYAVRRSAYAPLYNEACSDFTIATKMVEQGLRAVFEAGAVCTEDTNRRTDKELDMRVRVITQTFTDLWRHRSMLNPLRSGFFAVQLWSHKVMRYLVPLFLFGLLICSWLLIERSRFFAAVFFGQLLFYALAVLGWVLEYLGVQSRVLALPHYFVLANLASLLAFFKFLSGERYASWQPAREGLSAAPVSPAVNAADGKKYS